ncbi:histone H1.2-like [Pyrus ussuriensis x Pyrus communis]|uniref:Histone H1.2-like n=1 Tax=Pyrus ussuriensis x Pyrus communis TaxID=2448454 RepID=A0A5N5FUK3_9ROSA|nr:histone H1.2-like [Pyrus ussuriensis x Pyrus communis]
MSATEEVQVPAVMDPPPMEAPSTEEPKKEEKPVKQTKPKTSKERKPQQPKPKTKTVAHPLYFQMIKKALLALNEKSGSSPYAIDQTHTQIPPPTSLFRLICRRPHTSSDLSAPLGR